MYEHYSVTVDKGQNLLRIDKFLTNRMEGASRNRIQTAADAGNILVNGVPVKSSYKVQTAGSGIDRDAYPLREVEIIPENIPLVIRYEDDDLIIVNKRPAWWCIPVTGTIRERWVNALTYHLKDLPLFRDGDMRAGLVHRIDKNTSGILVVAKTNGRTRAWPNSFSIIRSIGSIMRWCGAIWRPTRARLSEISAAAWRDG